MILVCREFPLSLLHNGVILDVALFICMHVNHTFGLNKGTVSIRHCRPFSSLGSDFPSSVYEAGPAELMEGRGWRLWDIEV